MSRDLDRFWAKVDLSEGCWIWTAARTANGYGKFWADGRTVAAHRYAYEVLRGPIPSGLQLDHLCRNRACVNPAHLEPVSSQVNNLRGIGHAAVNAAKGSCAKGHPFTPENTYRRTDGRGQRQCRTCARDAQRRYAARQRAIA